MTRTPLQPHRDSRETEAATMTTAQLQLQARSWGRALARSIVQLQMHIIHREAGASPLSTHCAGCIANLSNCHPWSAATSSYPSITGIVASPELKGPFRVQAAHGKGTCVCISRCCQLRSADPTVSSFRRMESTLARDLMQSSNGSHARDMLGELTHMQETGSRDLQL